jgi:hypothetical protein
VTAAKVRHSSSARVCTALPPTMTVGSIDAANQVEKRCLATAGPEMTVKRLGRMIKLTSTSAGTSTASRRYVRVTCSSTTGCKSFARAEELKLECKIGEHATTTGREGATSQKNTKTTQTDAAPSHARPQIR